MAYHLLGAERTKGGLILHRAVMAGDTVEKRLFYRSVRMGLVWPSVESPAYFIVAGEEVEDDLDMNRRPLIRVIQEHEHKELSLDGLFDSMTDAYITTLCSELYVDHSREDFKLRLWEHLDKRRIQNISALDVPFKDIVLRFGLVGDYNSSGDLSVDKGSPLYEDLKSISRSHLKDNPEKWHRVNCLSYVIAGFEKFKSVPPIQVRVGKALTADWRF